MSQPGKLNTVAPSMRKDASTIGLAPPPERQPGAERYAIATGNRPIRLNERDVKISLEKTSNASVAFFSIQNLLSLMPGWSVSFVSHAVLLVLLAVIATAPISDSSALRLDALMIGAVDSPELDEMLIDNEQTDANVLNVDLAALNSEASKRESEFIQDDGLQVSLLEGIADGIGSEAFAEAGLTPLETGEQGGVEGTDGTSTQFFGTNASGNRFVFIIDASDSMNEGIRWHQALRELEKSIDKLTADQQVLVLLYNFQTFPMFDTPPEKLKLLPATDEFKEALKQWLAVQVPVGGTRPAHALSFSLTLKPDAIFLLSDGLLADNSIQVLARENSARRKSEGVDTVPVHTVSLGPHVEGAELMKIIADNNQGEFSWVR